MHGVTPAPGSRRARDRLRQGSMLRSFRSLEIHQALTGATLRLRRDLEMGPGLRRDDIGDGWALWPPRRIASRWRSAAMMRPARGGNIARASGAVRRGAGIWRIVAGGAAGRG